MALVIQLIKDINSYLNKYQGKRDIVLYFALAQVAKYIKFTYFQIRGRRIGF